MSSTSTSRPRVAAFVYLIQLAEFFKIGHSRNPAKRLRQFQGLPWKPKLLHHFPSECANVIEKCLHRRFSESRINGEWFRLTEDDVTAICALDRIDSPDDLPTSLWSVDRRISSPYRQHDTSTVRLPNRIVDILRKIQQMEMESGGRFQSIGEILEELIREPLRERYQAALRRHPEHQPIVQGF